MPSCCCVPGCKSNYKTEKEKVKVYEFPLKEECKTRWLKKIRRKNWFPGKRTVVCIKHFKEEDVIKEDSAIRPDGSVLVVSRTNWKLRPDAVPCIFENLSKNLSEEPQKRGQRKRKALHPPDFDEIENDNLSVEKEEKSDENLTTTLAVQDSLAKEHPAKASEEMVDKSAAISVDSTLGSLCQSKKIESVIEKVIVNSRIDDASKTDRVEGKKHEMKIIWIPYCAKLSQTELIPNSSQEVEIPTNFVSNNKPSTSTGQNDAQSTNDSMATRNTTSLAVFNFKTLKEENFVSFPWTSTNDKSFMSFLYWKPRNALERWIVVDKKLKAKVFLKGVEAKALNCEIDSPKTLRNLLKKVERETICEGRCNEYSYCTGIPDLDEFGKKSWFCKHCQDYEKRILFCKKCSQHSKIVHKKNLLIGQLQRKVQKYEALLNIQKKDSQKKKSIPSKRAVSLKGSNSEESALDLMTSDIELTEMSPLNHQGSSKCGQSNTVKLRIKPSTRKSPSKINPSSKSVDESSNGIPTSENTLSSRLFASENEPDTFLLLPAGHSNPVIEPVATTTLPVILAVTSFEPDASSGGGYLLSKNEPDSSFFRDVQPTGLISIKSEPMEESTSEHSSAECVNEMDSQSSEDAILPRIERVMTTVEQQIFHAQETAVSNSEDSLLQPPFIICKQEVVWSDEEM